ncbi:MAG: sirohydrochlorin chelatase, partial [Symploca sp. SIO3E6]|nr:sirohydrochlorin chelatase [Caldora sp. SIO3E6]
PRPQLAMAKLAELVHDELLEFNNTQTQKFSLPNIDQTAPVLVVSQNRYPLVGTATLELAPSTLHEQIQQFANLALGAGYQEVQLLPLFLLPGVHVMEDIPAEAAVAQSNLGDAIVLNLRPHLGAHPGLGRMLAKQLSLVETDAKILLAHGSRRVVGNEPVEMLAEQLGALAAYWLIPPTLEEQVIALADAGNQQITIIPYFLFSGGITDAIAQMVAGLQEQFPQLRLRLGEPIGVSGELAKLVLEN